MDALLFALSFEVVLLQMRILEGSVELRLADWRPTNKIEKLQQDKLAQDRSRNLRGEFFNLYFDVRNNEEDFYDYLSMSKETFDYICNGIRSDCNHRVTNFKKPISVEERLVLTIRDLVNDVIRRTLIEVAETGKWQSVKNAVELLKQSECDVESLRLKNEHLRNTRKNLEAQLNAKRNQWTMELTNADQKVAVLRDKLSDDLHNANTRLCYSEKWLFARFESLELKLDVPRAPPPRPDHEQRVHEELLKAFELQIKELEKTLEYWRQRYDTDIVEISARSQRKLEQLLLATSKRQELQQLYDLHTGEIRGWLTFKRERAARLAREEKIRLSAMRIQAWWRGVMVRRALGQFKSLRLLNKGKGKKK